MFAHENLVKNYFAFESIILLNSYKKDSLELALHFFCEVKTYKNHISQSAIEKNLEYWGNQPVPVFLFLVKYSNLKTINSDSKIWVYDLPYSLATNDVKSKGYSELKRDVKENFFFNM